MWQLDLVAGHKAIINGKMWPWFLNFTLSEADEQMASVLQNNPSPGLRSSLKLSLNLSRTLCCVQVDFNKNKTPRAKTAINKRTPKQWKQETLY